MEKQRIRANERVRSARTEQEALATADATPVVERSLSGVSQPVEAEPRPFVEPRFGHDFSRIRVQSEARASNSPVDVMRTPMTVQRSTLGTVVGGLLGGPLGALVGDALSSTSRPLSEAEKWNAHSIFQDNLDYDAITITRGSVAAAGASRTTGNTINLEDGLFVGDTLELTSQGGEILVHEMTHVWQYQHQGWTYAPEALWAQAKAWWQTGSNNAAYDWESLDTSGVPFEQWNPEAQAEAVEDYNKALQAANAGTATPADFKTLARLKKYIEIIQGGPAKQSPPGDYEPTPAPAGPDSGYA